MVIGKSEADKSEAVKSEAVKSEATSAGRMEMTRSDVDLYRQDLAGKTIYVVEDMEVPRSAMVGQLVEVGCHAVACQSAEDLEERLASAASGPALLGPALLGTAGTAPAEDRPRSEALQTFKASQICEEGSPSETSRPNVSPDLILLDLELPGRSGLETLRWLRGSERWRHVPIVVVTADEDSGIVDAALGAGCRSYLSKPVRTHHLVATCAKALR